eukprot:Awhi_evm1s895
MPFKQPEVPYDCPKQFIEDYSTWHTKMLFDTAIPCHKKQIFVYNSAVGLGDSGLTLDHRLFESATLGRLFFVGQGLQKIFTIGLSDPGFEWIYDEAIKKG